MREQLESRLEALRAEHENGQQKLAELQQAQTGLSNTLMRISGAIQVLEEGLTCALEAQQQKGENDGPRPTD
jgi:hypothetical protein